MILIFQGGDGAGGNKGNIAKSDPGVCMFNSLSKLFGGGPKERRQFPRTKMRFEFVWLRGEQQVPGLGTELSVAGCLIATQEAPPADFDAIFDFGRRKIRLRLHTVRDGPFTREGARWTGLGCTFSGVAADDYDALVRILKNIPESGNVAQTELAAKDRTDDAYRLLPLAVQHRVLATLAQRGRIDIPPEGQAPLLRMADLGLIAGGAHRLGVQSRIATDEGPQSFDSVLVITPDGQVKVEK